MEEIRNMILECFQLDVCPGRQAHSSSPGYCSNLKNQFVSTGFNNICEKQYTVSILQYINTNQNPVGHLLVRQDISSLQISDLKLKRMDIFIMPYHDPQKWYITFWKLDKQEVNICNDRNHQN